mgnify:CR=1 FL=1
MKYFEVNKEGLVKASFQEFSKKDTILFDIGTGEMEQYIKKGKLTFSINNVNLSLTAFQGNGSNVNRIFIPFADNLLKRVLSIVCWVVLRSLATFTIALALA